MTQTNLEAGKVALKLACDVRNMVRAENAHARGIQADRRAGREDGSSTSRDDVDMVHADLYASWPVKRLDDLITRLSACTLSAGAGEIAAAIADGFTNGNEQFGDASPHQQERYMMAARAVLSTLRKGQPTTPLPDQQEGESGLIERLRAYRPTNEWGDGVHHVICDEAADRIEALERRLEVVPGWSEDADGIACRNDTIELQDDRITTLSRRLAEADAVFEAIKAHATKLKDGTDDWFEMVEFQAFANQGLSALRQSGEEG
jgi:hypothetical protein